MNNAKDVGGKRTVGML